MPELPDLTIYQEAIEQRIKFEPLTGIRLTSPFILRTVTPTASEFYGKKLLGTQRLGKRIILNFQSDLYIAVHLMIAGRFQWYPAGKKLPAKLGLMAFDFKPGTLVLTEAGQKHRAAVHFIAGANNLDQFDQGGLEVLGASLDAFRSALSAQNRTLKRALTDPRFIAGIGNAYSDEILHQARLSPMRQTKHLNDSQWQALYSATNSTVTEWIERLRTQTGNQFPKKVTAFHNEMKVHGKFKQPCPDCGAPIQRIRYANNECNYCAACQNQGNILADRSLSKLLKQDWPKTLEELDQ
ncbi:MAG: Fpg/Nei family DNA glycosylase [Pseudomonadales bacterium]